jgi:hypothetical protein
VVPTIDDSPSYSDPDSPAESSPPFSFRRDGQRTLQCPPSGLTSPSSQTSKRRRPHLWSSDPGSRQAIPSAATGPVGLRRARADSNIRIALGSLHESVSEKPLESACRRYRALFRPENAGNSARVAWMALGGTPERVFFSVSRTISPCFRTKSVVHCVTGNVLQAQANAPGTDHFGEGPVRGAPNAANARGWLEPTPYLPA